MIMWDFKEIMAQNKIWAEQASAFGARGPQEAVRLMREAAEKGEKEGLDASPRSGFLVFSSKEEYVAARAAWRARQKMFEERVRAARALRRTGTLDARSCAQVSEYMWGVLAHAGLMERALQKKWAAREWEGSRAQALIEA